MTIGEVTVFLTNILSLMVPPDHSHPSESWQVAGNSWGGQAMTDDDGAGYSGAISSDESVYFEQRADWHRGRAAVAPDDSTRSLHEKFAHLYTARALSL